MPGIDPDRTFTPISIALLTITDTRSQSDDESGDLLEEMVIDAGHNVIRRKWVTDDEDAIRLQLVFWMEDMEVDVVLTTGGTGITARDVTPDVMSTLFDKEIPGFGELFRMLSYEKIGTSTIQSRAVAGVANGTLLFALPGSPGACRDAWSGILVHQLDNRFRPCNFVELLPRLKGAD